MPPLFRSLVFASLMLAFVAAPAIAETPDQARIKELERENDELRVELAQLRLALSQMKRELDKHKADNNDAEESDDGEAEPGSDSPVAGKDAESDDMSKTRTFRSADDIFRTIPDYLRPAKDGWDKAQTRTTGEWLKDNITGKRFTARKEIADVVIKYDSLKRLWNVVISFQDEKMSYMSWKMQEKVYPITLVGDKAFADASRKKYKPGRTIHVSGTITMIRWATIIHHKHGQNWKPEYCQIALDADEPR